MTSSRWLRRPASPTSPTPESGPSTSAPCRHPLSRPSPDGANRPRRGVPRQAEDRAGVPGPARGLLALGVGRLPDLLRRRHDPLLPCQLQPCAAPGQHRLLLAVHPLLLGQDEQLLLHLLDLAPSVLLHLLDGEVRVVAQLRELV